MNETPNWLAVFTRCATVPAQRYVLCHLGALTRLPMESRAVARMLPYATDSRCPPASAGDLCRKAHAREPWLPVLPPFGSSTETSMNPCLRLDVGAGKMMNTCLPGAHVLAAWHSLAAEALKPLFQHPDLRLVSGLTLTLTPIIPLPLPIALAQAPSR